MYLGIWQLKDLKEPMSRAGDDVGSNVLVPNLESSKSMASLTPLEKWATKFPEAFVGEAKGLSGRLCSKLHLFRKKLIFKYKRLGYFKWQSKLGKLVKPE